VAALLAHMGNTAGVEVHDENDVYGLGGDDEDAGAKFTNYNFWLRSGDPVKQ
jgi:hypothetical protein